MEKSDFDSTSFEATLYELKAMPSGEWRVLFVLPANESDNAVKLKDAFAGSIKVSVESMSHGGT